MLCTRYAARISAIPLCRTFLTVFSTCPKAMRTDDIVSVLFRLFLAECAAHINHEKIRFARVLELPLFKWRLTVVGTNSSQVSPPVHLLDDLYNTEPALFGYFVKGAPVLLTQNIQATRHLVNRTRAIMHSLMLRDAHEPPLQNPGFREVTLLHAPVAMCVVVGASPPEKAYWHGEALPKLSAQCEIDQPPTRIQIIPIFQSRQPHFVSCGGSFACINSIRKIHVRTLALELAFAFTDFRVQGRTMKQLDCRYNF